MNVNSRFAGVARAARALVGAQADDIVTDRLMTDPAPAADSAPDPVADPAPVDPAPETPTDPAPEAEPEDEPKPTPVPEPEADKPDAAASERARVATVFASEHSQGRERQAADMLGTSMSADEVIGLLAKSPKGGAASDAMLDRLSADPNPELGAGAGDEPDKVKSAETVWGKLWSKPPNQR